MDGLSAGYGDALVLSGLSLSVDPGEMVAVLGRNGAGKTTALLALAGLVPTTAGTVRVGDVDLTAAKPGARVSAGLVSVPDDRGLFPSLSVAEHFRLIGSSVDEAAALFPGLAKLAGRRVGACSGGEQQQVAVGLGMVRRPKVLCVDELSMGLAPQVAGELLAGLRTLADEGDTAVIVVEQFVDAVLAVADRGLVLSEGRVTHDEPAAALLADHASLEAAYLG
ncbi:MAG: ATP-binding cassette domain-containing protein [Microthrixaceae bacterium]|nr:ATP-binding cassette domain-containing protein [Microthrixaceae bacterium]